MRVVFRLWVVVACLGASGLYAARNSHSGAKTDVETIISAVEAEGVPPEVLDKRLQEAKEIARVTGVPFNEKFVADSLNFWEQRGLMVPDPEVSDRDIADYFTDVLHLPATSNNIELGREYIDVKEGRSDGKSNRSDDGAKEAKEEKREAKKEERREERREENREAKEIRREIGREIGNENLAAGKTSNQKSSGGGNESPAFASLTGAVTSPLNSPSNSPGKLSGLTPSPILPAIPPAGPIAFTSPKEPTEIAKAATLGGLSKSFPSPVPSAFPSLPPTSNNQEAKVSAQVAGDKPSTQVNLSLSSTNPPSLLNGLVPAAVGSSETGVSGNYGELVRETFGIESVATDKNAFFKNPVESPVKYAIPSPVNAYLNLTVNGGTSDNSVSGESSGSAVAQKTGVRLSSASVGGILDRFMSGWRGRGASQSRGLSSRAQVGADSDALSNDNYYAPTPVKLTERQTKLRRFFNWTLISLLSGLTASGIYGFSRRKES